MPAVAPQETDDVLARVGVSQRCQQATGVGGQADDGGEEHCGRLVGTTVLAADEGWEDGLGDADAQQPVEVD
jgi:hypothetical protein